MSTITLPGVQLGNSSVVRNYNTVQQVFTAATRTYITGSKLKVPRGGLKAGTKIRWKFNMTKTAAGTATSTIDIAVGTAGTTADTAKVSFTKPAGTAAADEGLCEVEAIVRSVSATGVIAGEFTMGHNLASTGHAVIPFVAVLAVGAGFDNTGDDLYVGLCLTTGASDAITSDYVDAEMILPG